MGSCELMPALCIWVLLSLYSNNEGVLALWLSEALFGETQT